MSGRSGYSEFLERADCYVSNLLVFFIKKVSKTYIKLYFNKKLINST